MILDLKSEWDNVRTPCWNIEIERAVSPNNSSLVYFYAPWYNVCKELFPMLENISSLKSYKEIRFYSYNVDKMQYKQSSYNIVGIPTILLFKSKDNTAYMFNKLEGFISEDKLTNILDKFLLRRIEDL